MRAWLARVRSRGLQLLAHEAALGAGFSVGLKLASSGLNVLMLALMARMMTQVSFGAYAMWFNAASLLAVVAACGQEKLILRSWSEYVESGRDALARGALVFGIAVALLASLATTLLVLAFGLIAGTEPALLAGACAFVVLQAVFAFSSHATRAIAGIGWGEGHEITWRVVVTLGAAAALLHGTPFGAAEFFLLADIGLALGIIFQACAALSRMPPAVRRAATEIDTTMWSRRSLRMWTATMLEAASQFVEVILVGLVLSPAAAGGFFVAMRLANAFAMVTGGLYNYSTRQVATLHYQGSGAKLSENMRVMASLTTAFVGVGIVAIALAGHKLLEIFGPDYVGSYPLLLVLSVGTASLALVGPAPAVLLLTGHEGAYSRVILASIVVRCGGVILLAPAFGAAGAALASAAGQIGMAVALGLACRRCAGVDPSPLTLLFGRRHRT